MSSALNNDDLPIFDLVDYSVRFVYSATPIALQASDERFRLVNTGERMAIYVPQKQIDAPQGPFILRLPVKVFITRFIVLNLIQHPHLSSHERIDCGVR
jgi:hypothetical protein